MAVGYDGDAQSHLYYKIENGQDKEAVRRILSDYFNLSHDLEALYEDWSKDAYFKERASHYPAIRLLRQDPVETLFAFICSQNNGIGRITKMVQHLKAAHGPLVATYQGHKLHAFPPASKLLGDGRVGELTKAGFGYRAKYIHGAAKLLCDGQVDLLGLREEPYEGTIEALLRFPGIGPKVADCIALMSLDKAEAVPVDTHIWQVAAKHYRMVPAGKTKSMTRTAYREISDRFRAIFGMKAGWAHLVLFASQSRLRKK